MSEKLVADLQYTRDAADSLAHADPGTKEYREAVTRLLVGFKALDGGGAFRHLTQQNARVEGPFLAGGAQNH